MLKDWKELFEKVSEKPYSRSLNSFLDREYETKTIYPPRDMMFQAFKFTSPKNVKVVIIGQDPYHNPGEAMGLSFSVPRGIDIPPSLRNIYKEIEADQKIKMNFDNGDLTPWAEQGCLLLNAYLSVEANKPLSHVLKEYGLFMEDVLSYLDSLNQPMVFMLWGGFARKFKTYVKNPKHLVLEAAHPSPLSANRGGWFGNHLFTKCNDFLIENGYEPIDWKID